MSTPVQSPLTALFPIKAAYVDGHQVDGAKRRRSESVEDSSSLNGAAR